MRDRPTRVATTLLFPVFLVAPWPAIAQDLSHTGYVERAAASAPRAILPGEAPPPGLTAVHRCTTTDIVAKARSPGAGRSQHTTVTTRFGAYAGDSYSVIESVHVATGEFVEEFELHVPVWWLPYGLAAEERRIPKPGAEAGFIWRGTLLDDGIVPELAGAPATFRARITEDMDWITTLAEIAPQRTRFSTAKDVTVSVGSPIPAEHAVLGRVSVARVNVTIRNADTPARQEWEREYAIGYWVPVAIHRRDFNAKDQPVREMRCELESYTRP
jgi:hypothetical protein